MFVLLKCSMLMLVLLFGLCKYINNNHFVQEVMMYLMLFRIVGVYFLLLFMFFL